MEPIAFRNFPLNEMPPDAEPAAKSAEFADAHWKFWEIHDSFFENQNRLGGDRYLELAQEFKIGPASLREAPEQGKFTEKVRADFIGGVRSGVNGTPTFFINGQRHDAPFDDEDLVAHIEEAIAPA